MELLKKECLLDGSDYTKVHIKQQLNRKTPKEYIGSKGTPLKKRYIKHKYKQMIT